MRSETLLLKLPDFREKWKVLTPQQTTWDIVDSMPGMHERYKQDYDRIAADFVGSSDEQTFENIFYFLKQNVRYEKETARRQVLKSPSAIIETGVCDCKCYALFIAGVLDALNRKGAGYDVYFLFATYPGNRLPGHVFIEVATDNRTYWIDPVLDSFDKRTPAPIDIKRKRVSMALYELSGIENIDASAPADKQACVVPYEGLDQQLVRLTNCSTTLDSGVLVPADSLPTLYDLPTSDGPPLSSPVDALAIDPGVPVTMQPAPPASDLSPSSDNPGIVPPGNDAAIPPVKNGLSDWISNNKGLAIGGLILAVILLSKKKKRRP